MCIIIGASMCLWWLMHYVWALLVKYCQIWLLFLFLCLRQAIVLLNQIQMRYLPLPVIQPTSPENQSPTILLLLQLICMIITSLVFFFFPTLNAVWVNFARKWADISRSFITYFRKSSMHVSRWQKMPRCYRTTDWLNRLLDFLNSSFYAKDPTKWPLSFFFFFSCSLLANRLMWWCKEENIHDGIEWINDATEIGV